MLYVPFKIPKHRHGSVDPYIVPVVYPENPTASTPSVNPYVLRYVSCKIPKHRYGV